MSTKSIGVVMAMVAGLVGTVAFAGTPVSAAPSKTITTGPTIKIPDAATCAMTKVAGKPNQATVKVVVKSNDLWGDDYNVVNGQWGGTSMRRGCGLRQDQVVDFTWTASGPITDWTCHLEYTKDPTQCIH